MSRFANRRATGRLVLSGGCQCPGTPHDEDWIEMRTQLGTADAIAIAQGTSVDSLELLIVAWNLVDDDGPATVDRPHVEALFADTFNELDAWVEANVTVVTLPNPSGGHSRNGSRVAASSARGKRTGR